MKLIDYLLPRSILKISFSTVQLPTPHTDIEIVITCIFRNLNKYLKALCQLPCLHYYLHNSVLSMIVLKAGAPNNKVMITKTYATEQVLSI